MIFRKCLVGCVVILFVMTGCSVDHSATDNPVTAKQENYISGMVLAGGPVEGTVSLKSMQAGIPLEGAIDENGHYSIHLLDYWVGPYILQAKGTVGGRSIYLHALGTRGDVSANVNITPLTELVTGNVLGRDPKVYFEDTSQLSMKIVIKEEAIDKHEDLVKNRFSELLQSVDVDTEAYNLLNTDLSDEAHHTKADALFDILRLTRNMDTEGQADGTMTISTIVDPSVSVVDDFTDEFDADPLTIENTRLQHATSHVYDIIDRFALWESLFANYLPSTHDEDSEGYDTLKSLFSDDLMYNGYGLQDFLDLICSTSSLERMAIFNIRVDAFDDAAHTATVSFKIKDHDDMVQTFYGWHLELSEDGWKLRGNQQKLSVNAGAYLAAQKKSNSMTVFLNGIYLYAYAPFTDSIDDIDYIEVMGPWINGSLRLNPVENHLNHMMGTVFTHEIQNEAQPQGFFYPADTRDTSNTYVGEDNAEYRFSLYRENASEGEPATLAYEYKTTIPFATYENLHYNDSNNDTILNDTKSPYFVTFESPGVLDLKDIKDGEFIDVRWVMPDKRLGLSINYMWTPQTSSSYKTEEINNDFPYDVFTLPVAPERFDIYIRSVDSFEMMIDSFICRKLDGEDEDDPVPISLIEQNFLF